MYSHLTRLELALPWLEVEEIIEDQTLIKLKQNKIQEDIASIQQETNNSDERQREEG